MRCILAVGSVLGLGPRERRSAFGQGLHALVRHLSSALNRPGVSGDSGPWEGWSYVNIEEVSGGVEGSCCSDVPRVAPWSQVKRPTVGSGHTYPAMYLPSARFGSLHANRKYSASATHRRVPAAPIGTRTQASKSAVNRAIPTVLLSAGQLSRLRNRIPRPRRRGR